MKLISIFFTFLFCVECKNPPKVEYDWNDRICEAQKKSISISPFSDAASAKSFPDAQKEFRAQVFQGYMTSKISTLQNRMDTLIIAESFINQRTHLSTSNIDVLIKDTIYTLSLQTIGAGRKMYLFNGSKSGENSTDVCRHSEVIEIRNEIRTRTLAAIDPFKHGAACDDGDHTIITVLYPGNRIEALYVRCWMPTFIKDRIKLRLN